MLTQNLFKGVFLKLECVSKGYISVVVLPTGINFKNTFPCPSFYGVLEKSI